MDELSKRLLGHEPITLQDRGRDRQGAEELQARRAGRGDLLRRRGRRRHPAHLRAPAAAAGARGPAHRLRDPGAADARRCWSRWSWPASRSTRSGCASSPTTSRVRMGELEAEAHRAGRPAVQPGQPQADRRHAVRARWAWPGGKTTATGAMSTDASMLEDLAAQGHELPRILLDWRQLSKLKGTYTDNLVAAIDPRTGRVHTSFRWRRPPPGGSPRRDPNLQNIPVRTEEGRKIRQAFIAEPGPRADQRRLQPDRAAAAGPHRRHPAAEDGVRRRPGHPRHDRLGDVRRAGRGHAGRDAPARQGDQLRHRLRHLGLRPRQPAGRSRARRPAPTSRPTSSASPASATYMDRMQPAGARRGLRHHHLRPQGAHPGRAAASRRPSAPSPTGRRSTPRSRAPPPT